MSKKRLFSEEQVFKAVRIAAKEHQFSNLEFEYTMENLLLGGHL